MKIQATEGDDCCIFSNTLFLLVYAASLPPLPHSFLEPAPPLSFSSPPCLYFYSFLPPSSLPLSLATNSLSSLSIPSFPSPPSSLPSFISLSATSSFSPYPFLFSPLLFTPLLPYNTTLKSYKNSIPYTMADIPHKSQNKCISVNRPRSFRPITAPELLDHNWSYRIYLHK